MGIYVSEIFRYPLKSGKAETLSSAYVTPTGFAGDRQTMLVYADGPDKGRFISQRDDDAAKLALVHMRITESHQKVKLDFNATGPLWSVEVDITGADDLDDVRVWASQCKGIDAGETPAAYFSNYLGKPVRVMIYPKAAPRAVDPQYGQALDTVSYADGFPFLITSKPSLNSLREHFTAGVEIGMDRFRPNIVLDGNLPWEEDVMHEIRIGDVRLEVVKPCARCMMTTIDQYWGEKGETNEPLGTLAKMRRGKGDGIQGVFFGQNAIPRSLGRIHAGDEVEILSTRPLHAALEKNELKFGM